MRRAGLFIDGAERPAQTREEYAIEAPEDGALIGHAARARGADVDVAVAAARRALDGWAYAAPAERERPLLRAAAELERQGAERFLDLLIDESGSTVQKARYEIDYTVEVLRAAAGEARRLYGDTLPHDRPDRLSMVWREPVGVVAALSPFNGPLVLFAKMVIFPLAAGATVVAKPSEATPLIAVELARLLGEAGLPAGVLGVLTGFGAECGEPLVAHPGVDGVAFTGSTATGQRIAQAAGAQLKRLQLELGGKNPLLVLADVDPDEAAEVAVAGSFPHAGQICMASSRIIVERPRFDAFVEALVRRAERLRLGPLRDAATAYGPLIHRTALDKVIRHVDEAVARGARLVTGGAVHQRLTYRPTVLVDTPRDCLAWREETFGPVVNVVAADDLEHAIALANDSDYALSAGLLTRDLPRAFAAARRLRAGAVHVGTHSFQSNVLAPVGGLGLSGLGRSGGKYSIEAFTELKWVSVGLA